MAEVRTRQCPECGTGLEDGFLGYGTGLLWHESRLRGWHRLFPFAIAEGNYIVGNWTSTGLITSIPARKCPACGTVVLLKTA
jgi:ribosomal protein S27AE